MVTAAPPPKANMGEPKPRIDAIAKVTGTARYPSDVPVEAPAYAFFVTSAIAKGRIVAIELREAEKVSGVLAILTHENASDAVAKSSFFGEGGYAAQSLVPLAGPQIAHEGQIVAVVVADTFEAAREAAFKVKVEYEREEPTATFDSPGNRIIAASEASKRHQDAEVGDATAALASAEVTVDARYSTPTQHHNPIELFTTTCVWNGPELTIHEPSQFVYGLKNGVAEQLRMDPAKVRVISAYVGGAFGSKGSVTPRTALVAFAAKRIGRPVKLVMPRDQAFTLTTYRAETRHRVQLGASKDGKLTALVHEGWEVTSRADNYLVGGTDTTARLYNCPNVSTKVSIVKADRNTPGFMRSPPEVPYVYALECAMDELAEKLGMDPIELRRVNDTMTEPIKKLPYTSRSLMKCFDEAAAAFRWKDRNPKAASMRDGDWLVGMGCAMATYPSHVAPTAVRLMVRNDGTVTVETAAHDVGTGAYTVIAQFASERLAVPIEKVTVKLGDSTLPPAVVAGGSTTTASVTNAVAKACDAVLRKLNANRLGIGPAEIAKAIAEMPMGAIEEYAEWVPEGMERDALKKLYQGRVDITGGTRLKDRVQFAFGAELVEVRVHARTREIRVPRIVGAFAGGHIVNTRTARSQLMGGMIWGIGSALHEATEIDRGSARYVNDNLADYLIAVNADIRQLEVILVPEEDNKVNPTGVKGLGELGNVGTAAAIANAVYHATGTRIRDLPIRIDNLIA